MKTVACIIKSKWKVEANPHLEYTVMTCAVDGNNASGQFDNHLNQISSGDTADFRVQAQVWV